MIEKTTTTTKPNIYEPGLFKYKTFNIGINQIDDDEEGNSQYECESLTLKNPSLADVVAEYTAADITLTEEEKSVVIDKCNESTYAQLVSAIIKARYPEDEMDAVRNNYDRVRDGKAGDKTEQYTAEYDAMQSWRDHAKEVAVQYVSKDDD